MNIEVIILLLVILLIGVYLLFRGLQQQFYHREERWTKEKESLTVEIQHLQESLQSLKIDKAHLEKDLEFFQVQYHQIKEEQTQQDQRFEAISKKILLDQNRIIEEQQSKELKQVLEPLQERIGRFEKRLEYNHLEAEKRNASFREQIKFLTEKTDIVSRDASNLARALKGDFKKQGNWGELILESILEKSGLEKDREYFIQNSLRNGENRLLRPDVVIHLPEERRMVIDSKVSLVSYEKAVNAEDEEDQLIHTQAHTLAIKNHIDQLSAKDYHKLYGIKSPDFVLMFIPIDTAFGMALQNDAFLYQYAFDRNLVIVTPSTLLATLKTVDTMWRHEKQNRYALEIANEAGKMYDKFVNFVEDLNKVGKQLDTVKNTWNESMKKLQTGKGNLTQRAEKIKHLGANSSKTLTLTSDK